jgi:hypothetical protein
MSNKITDARMEELERLVQLKEELQKKLQDTRDAMEEIRKSMRRDGVSDLISSSSNAAKKGRKKAPSTLNHEEVLETYTLAMARLGEDFEKVDQELRGLQELMK